MFGGREEVFTCLNTSPFDFTSRVFFASTFHFCFNKSCTNSELLVVAEHSDSELFDNSLSIFWNFDLTGIADTPCRRSPFALTFSEVTFPEFWRLPQNSFVSSVRLQPCSACQNAHLLPSFRFSIDGKEHVGGCQLSRAFSFEQSPT